MKSIVSDNNIEQRKKAIGTCEWVGTCRTLVSDNDTKKRKNGDKLGAWL